MKTIQHLVILPIMLVVLGLDLSAQILPRRVVESEQIINLQENMRVLVSENIFYFKRVEKDKGVVLFTYEDALNIEKYFVSQPGVLTCESDYLNKKFIVTCKKENQSGGFSIQKSSADLEPMGYVVVGARSNTTFREFKPKITTQCDKLKKGGSLASTPAKNPIDPDCNDCDEIKKSSKFDNIDYGGDVMIYDMNSIPAGQAGMTSAPMSGPSSGPSSGPASGPMSAPAAKSNNEEDCEDCEKEKLQKKFEQMMKEGNGQDTGLMISPSNPSMTSGPADMPAYSSSNAEEAAKQETVENPELAPIDIEAEEVVTEPVSIEMAEEAKEEFVELKEATMEETTVEEVTEALTTPVEEMEEIIEPQQAVEEPVVELENEAPEIIEETKVVEEAPEPVIETQTIVEEIQEEVEETTAAPVEEAVVEVEKTVEGITAESPAPEIASEEIEAPNYLQPVGEQSAPSTEETAAVEMATKKKKKSKKAKKKKEEVLEETELTEPLESTTEVIEEAAEEIEELTEPVGESLEETKEPAQPSEQFDVIDYGADNMFEDINSMPIDETEEKISVEQPANPAGAIVRDGTATFKKMDYDNEQMMEDINSTRVDANSIEESKEAVKEEIESMPASIEEAVESEEVLEATEPASEKEIIKDGADTYQVIDYGDEDMLFDINSQPASEEE